MSISIILAVEVFPQDCQECKIRRVIMYDNQVNVQRPTSVDSIYRYWDYFFIAGGVRDYFSRTDPSRDCILRLDGAFYTKKDTITNYIKFGAEHANTPPSGGIGGVADYLVYGVVNGQSCTLRLETAKTRELVKSGVLALPAGFEPIQTGKTLAAFVGPLYTSIMDFEKKKRDQGEPYALSPKVTLIAGKSKLNVNEKTTIDVLFKDCDGAPLKNRHLSFFADGGTLKSAELTTDDQGRGTLEFTAGPVPALANITSDYEYQKPSGEVVGGEVEPASIQIEKPNTSWYVTALFEISNVSTLTGTSQYENVSSGSMDHTQIVFYAWVTNINPVSGQFSSIPMSTSQLVFSGNYTGSSHWHSHSEASAGSVYTMLDDQLASVVNAGSTKAQVPDLTLSIYKGSFSFSINKIDAVQTGGETRTRITVDPIVGQKTETTVTPASPKKSLGLTVQSLNRDTVYSMIENTTQAGRTTKTVTQVSQLFSWKNNVCVLKYVRGTREDSHLDGIYTEDTYSNQTFTVTLTLSYTGDPPTGVATDQPPVPASFALNQNYPNPFNPSTTISYALPNATHATLTVTDLLGRNIATLVDEVEPAGLHLVQWNAGGLPSGVYFLRMNAGGFVDTKKMLLAK
jgi:hypothetical protein